jgi:hypothetical protein
MKRVIIVPVTETRQFPDMEIIARGGSIVALVGDTFEERTRSAFDSDDSFFYSVGYGRTDLYTFNTLEEAPRFAEGKIEALTAIERGMKARLADTTGSLKMTPIAVHTLGPRRKRAWHLVYTNLEGRQLLVTVSINFKEHW